MAELVRGGVEGTSLKIAVNGKVDTSNANQVEESINKLLTTECKAIEIDCTNLQYISSVGLRVLLKLKKSGLDVKLTEVSSDVYEILDVTGFSEILNVEKAMRFVSIEGCQYIGKGGHGKVYRIDEETIIKTFHDGSSMEMIDHERELGRNAFINGIPCAIAFDVVRCEEGYGLVYEMAGVSTLSAFLTEHPEKLPEYSVKFAQIMKDMNSTVVDKSLYIDFKGLYRESLSNTIKYFEQSEVDELLRLLDAIPDGDTMIHGDFHPNNVMVNKDGELMIIDMADIGYGCPLFDIGGTCLTMFLSGQTVHEITKASIGIDFELACQMWNIMLSTYYGTTDPEKLKLLFGRCVAMAMLRMACVMGRSESNLMGREKSMTEAIRNNLLPKIDEYCMLMKMPM